MVLGTARKDFLLDARLSQEVLRKPSRFRFGWQEVHKMWKLNSYFMEKGVNNNFMRMEQLKLNHFQLHRAVNSEFSYRIKYNMNFRCSLSSTPLCDCHDGFQCTVYG